MSVPPYDLVRSLHPARMDLDFYRRSASVKKLLKHIALEEVIQEPVLELVIICCSESWTLGMLEYLRRIYEKVMATVEWLEIKFMDAHSEVQLNLLPASDSVVELCINFVVAPENLNVPQFASKFPNIHTIRVSSYFNSSAELVASIFDQLIEHLPKLSRVHMVAVQDEMGMVRTILKHQDKIKIFEINGHEFPAINYFAKNNRNIKRLVLTTSNSLAPMDIMRFQMDFLACVANIVRFGAVRELKINDSHLGEKAVEILTVLANEANSHIEISFNGKHSKNGFTICVEYRMLAFMGYRGNIPGTPHARFLKADGDGHIMRRVIRWLDKTKGFIG